MKKHPYTICYGVPFSMLGGAVDPRTAAEEMEKIAKAKRWDEALDGPADDDRVLWTIGEDAIYVWFRRTPEDVSAGR